MRKRAGHISREEKKKNVIGMRKLLLGEDVKTSQLKYKNRRMTGFSDASAKVEN